MGDIHFFEKKTVLHKCQIGIQRADEMRWNFSGPISDSS